MPRMTNRTYYARCNAISEKRDAVNEKLADLNRTYAEPLHPPVLSADVCDYWNSLHDTRRELEQERQDLDREYRRRNWTAYDWQQWELVCSNVD